MPSFARLLSAGLALATLSVSTPVPAPEAPAPATLDKRSLVQRDGQNFTVFEHAATGAKIEFVKNSGICEKTAGVNQYSGYLDVGNGGSMFFWFFEARNNPTTAPVVTWFNGGPGCSSMIGLFQENGPCHFENGASTPSNNTYSFNNYANMLYVDQPVGVGFSTGSTNSVDSTETAAPYVWKLLQAFWAQFPQYENRDFGIFTESYGGHYGPEFAEYVEQQNAAIKQGSINGTELNLVALAINNGWYDATLQHKAYVDFSYNNTYKPIIDADQYSQFLQTYNNDCKPALQACAASGSDSDCSRSDSTCDNRIQGPLSQTSASGGAAAYDFDVYDIREPSNDPYPPSAYSSYINQASVRKAIGARQSYTECSDSVGAQFSRTGDNSRSFLPELSELVASGLPTVIWAGDADWICNWFGGQAAADAISWSSQSRFAGTPLAPYTVGGSRQGDYKQIDNLAFLRVYGAGHEVPYYQPKLALQVLQQLLTKKGLSST